MQDNMETVFALTYLSSCALNEVQLSVKEAETFDFSAIYHMARRHSISSTTYIGLKSVMPQLKLSEEEKRLLRDWEEEKNKADFSQVSFDIERATIFSYLSSIGCRHMPLKGVILKDYYPSPFMRQMSDNDILFDKNYDNQLKDFMISRGYDARVEISKDDVYTKKPLFNFEMHRSLFDHSENPILADYYENVDKRLLCDKNNPCLWHFTKEDFYIYIIAHAFHHCSGSGFGLRILLDIYVYLKKESDILNWAYINRECAESGMDNFEATLRSLSIKLMSYPQNRELTEDEYDMLEYITSSGTFGTRRNRIQNDLKRMKEGETSSAGAGVKLRYLLNRIFLSKEQMKSKYPWIRKHPWLLPLGYLNRIIFKGIPDIRRLWAEFKFIWKK